jgi:sugar phosphate isomerase/epimerase
MSEPITRRTFLAATGVAAALARVRAASPWPIGVESYCFHDVDFATTIARTKQLGLKAIELHDGHLPYDSTPAALASAKQAFAAAGIAPRGVYIHDAFTENEAVARPIFQYAKTVGFGYINGGPRPEALPLLDRLSPEYGVRIAIHNHGPKARYETIEDVMSALEGRPNLASCVDIGHFARSKVDPAAAIRRIGRRALAVHVKDVTASGDNIVVGKGTIDMPAVFAALKETRFDGLLVLEYEGDFDDMEKRMRGMEDSLRAIERFLA